MNADGKNVEFHKCKIRREVRKSESPEVRKNDSDACNIFSFFKPVFGLPDFPTSGLFFRTISPNYFLYGFPYHIPSISLTKFSIWRSVLSVIIIRMNADGKNVEFHKCKIRREVRKSERPEVRKNDSDACNIFSFFKPVFGLPDFPTSGLFFRTISPNYFLYGFPYHIPSISLTKFSIWRSVLSVISHFCLRLLPKKKATVWYMRALRPPLYSLIIS